MDEHRAEMDVDMGVGAKEEVAVKVTEVTNGVAATENTALANGGDQEGKMEERESESDDDEDYDGEEDGDSDYEDDDEEDAVEGSDEEEEEDYEAGDAEFEGDVGDGRHRLWTRKRGRESGNVSIEAGGSLGNGVDEEVEHRTQRARTTEELLAFYQGTMSEEDSDDDSDWDPQEDEPSWHCVNCTSDNLDLEEVSHCRLCGEHRASGILKRGHVAPVDSPEESVEPSADKGAVAAEDAAHIRVESTADCTAVAYDDRMLLHYEMRPKSNPHPERPDRLRAIMGGLAAEGLYPGRCIPLPVREISLKEVEMVHCANHVETVECTAEQKESYFTLDTYANQDSAMAARLAAGCAADMAIAIAKGEIKNGLAMIRPPGHHAETSNVMGFCLHNNAAIAARAAQTAGVKKILILDWDVHHGNGTQEIFDSDPSVLFISIHRYEGGMFYPGTGSMHETGTNEGEGFSVNVPWRNGGVGDNDYLAAFKHVVMPIAKRFSPEMTIISAGFDAAAGDPLGACEVSPSGYANMAAMLMTLCGGRVLVVLEGGYNLRSISSSVAAVAKVLLGDDPPPATEEPPTPSAMVSISEVCRLQSRYWPGLEVPEAPILVEVEEPESEDDDGEVDEEEGEDDEDEREEDEEADQEAAGGGGTVTVVEEVVADTKEEMVLKDEGIGEELPVLIVSESTDIAMKVEVTGKGGPEPTANGELRVR